MMRKTLIVLLMSTLTLSVWNSANAQKGKVLLDFYYGFPNLWSSAAERVVGEQFNLSGLDLSSVGPLGARAEIMVSKRIGLGVDVLFAESGLNFNASQPDANGEGGTETYNYDVSVKRPRVYGRLNLHLINNRVIDSYFALGLGYNGTNANVETDNPLFDSQDLKLPLDLPIAARAGFGVRLYLLKWLGVGAEVGIGGPLVTGGVTLRI